MKAWWVGKLASLTAIAAFTGLAGLALIYLVERYLPAAWVTFVSVAVICIVAVTVATALWRYRSFVEPGSGASHETLADDAPSAPTGVPGP